MATENYPRLILPAGFTKGHAMEIEMKGWYPADVEAPDGRRYTLTFFEPVRLGQELAELVRNGEPCFFEHNLVVVPTVTMAAMEASIRFLWEHKLFDDLLPDSPGEENANPL